MSVRSRVLIAAALLGAVVLVSAMSPDVAHPARHFMRNALRALF
jgi:hypothetical protein